MSAPGQPATGSVATRSVATPRVLRGPFCDCEGASPGPVLVCPRRDDPDVDCVPRPPDRLGIPLLSDAASRQPFLRYRQHIAAGRVAPAAYEAAVSELDDAVADLTGRRLEITPTVDGAAVMAALGRPGVGLLLKDETGQPAASHKIRHMFGLGLHVRLRAGCGSDLDGRRLAIASCGNAAHAAAVVAAALEWPLDVFVPPGADPGVLAELDHLGARVVSCPRLIGERGDPCQRAFRDAVSGGAVAFGVQGPDNGWAIDGGRTIAFELAEAATAVGPGLDHVVVQVGGGALAAATWSGLDLAVRLGVLDHRPVLGTVQTAGAAPLARAGAIVAARAARHGLGPAMAWAVRHRREVMWPWEQEPHSIASGIVDDETYDWAAVVDGVLSSDGAFAVVDENALVAANRLVAEQAGIDADETGTAGLAGLVSALGGIADGAVAAVLVTGGRRRAGSPDRSSEEQR